LVLVHGSFHSPSSFHLIKPKLEALSYPVVTPHLPSSKGESPTTNLADDVTAIHEVIIPLMNAGKEIVIVAHSYGGTPGCAAVEGQTIAERSARGEMGGIKSILFISAVLVPKRGGSCGEAWGASGGETPHVDVKVMCFFPSQLHTNFLGTIWSRQRKIQTGILQRRSRGCRK
jgi:pimeloyl-ACP methyl ester carboxylesterase